MTRPIICRTKTSAKVRHMVAVLPAALPQSADRSLPHHAAPCRTTSSHLSARRESGVLAIGSRPALAGSVTRNHTESGVQVTSLELCHTSNCRRCCGWRTEMNFEKMFSGYIYLIKVQLLTKNYFVVDPPFNIICEHHLFPPVTNTKDKGQTA